MIYAAYQAQADLLDPLRTMARLSRRMIETAMGGSAMAGPPLAGLAAAGPGAGAMMRNMVAALEMFERFSLSHQRPAFGIDTVTVGNREVAVTEEVTASLPFGSLLHFKKDVEQPQPRVLVVAPLSGHFATLLHGTVKTLLPENDVYVTDWHNARDVPLSAGPFGFDDYVEHVIRFLEIVGPGAHALAVCQPCVQVLVATAVMSQQDNPATPHSITLMAGPVDTRVNPTKVNELATSKPMDWFEKNLISTVPAGFPGAGRRVYPGFVQVGAFMAMNMDRHVKAHVELFENLAMGEHEKAATSKNFYDEYFAVLDLAAEFYLETIRIVFQEHELPRGVLTYRGDTVDLRAIRRTALLTVEGERDDICAVGQTVAAQDLCSSLRPHRKRHHMQAGVGHYGVFSGRRWQSQVYPLVRNHILAAD
ncbi:polyhydroxyalkanoate depolymerase [Ancylobacter defluvii]|uniref:Poly(3-hydroxybutyrate) depolymerase n=1 Tax=Ancylobacter defluvii TaxID=1282440 RepID=A0A9W6NA38_9HYPH|nr:polyhydroxyalkanoate depolymerase [Ancylobacter defluvii]MBS7590272.1 polyhydroxyalkanoate depolymerase [Ancylobacter defluvii]GLK83185.1 poly(3-hydroxybutyrate) depolymerase [Ancylobacter defluvii]